MSATYCEMSVSLFINLFIYIRFLNYNFKSLFCLGALAKNGSFGFAEGSARGQGKSKCAVCAVAIQNILCGGKKIKTQKGSQRVSAYSLSVCNIVSMSFVTCQNGLLFLVYSRLCLLCCVVLRLLVTFCSLAKWRTLKHFLSI